jgi:hypothetical protein
LKGGADHILGTIDSGGVDQRDAEVQRPADDPHGMIRRLPGSQAKPAETATSQTGDTDLQTGTPKRGVLHEAIPPSNKASLAGWIRRCD